MTNVFVVVGQHEAEPNRLLLLGDDGRYYAYAADGQPTAIEPSGAWRLDDQGAGATGSEPADAGRVARGGWGVRAGSFRAPA